MKKRFGLVSVLCLLGCSEKPDDTVTVSVHETSGTIEACCRLKGNDWQMTLVGTTSNQALLSLQGEERGFMELRDGNFEEISQREGFAPTTFAGREAVVRRPSESSKMLTALVGYVNEHPEHLAIQIRCVTPQCAEFDVLERDLVLHDARP
ncbi:MAG: hypothetical protein V2J51_01535 [Erythrobacter sp.]|jgi:hypothetical protein|nr:hypothetical protein [Erythrobacter sp.]